MGTFELVCEFDITRRVGWSDEELADHIDTVFERLHQAKSVQLISADADLDSGRTTIRVDYTSLVADDPEHFGRATLGIAIRSCGGGHRGLLPFAEEAGLKPDRNQWSGLKTPTWNVRQVTMTKASTNQ